MTIAILLAGGVLMDGEDQDKKLTEGERNVESIAVLCDDVVEILSVESANTVHRLFTSHLLDQVHPSVTLQRLTGGHNKLTQIAQDKARQSTTAVLEGTATTVCYCKPTAQIAVGFSSGGVGLVHAFKSDAGPSILLHTNEVHGSPICMLLSFPLPRGKKNIDGSRTERDALLVGDQSGILSTWQINPRWVGLH